MIKKQVEYELDKLGVLASRISKELSVLPSEVLHEEKNGIYYRYYLRHNGKKQYLHKKDFEYILALAKKQHLHTELESLKMQHAFLSDYLLCITNDLSTDNLSNPKLLNNILFPTINTSNSFTEAWLHEPFKTNPRHPEHLTQRTDFGLKVRSKSEGQIATALHNHGIPFRYEAELELNGVYIYPDFTIMHPITEKIMYWEHFGRMDDPHYREEFSWKMRMYPQNNIMPSRDLIMTFECESKQLDSVTVEQVIKDYFIECTL